MAALAKRHEVVTAIIDSAKDKKNMAKTNNPERGSMCWPVSNTSDTNPAQVNIKARIGRCPRCGGEHAEVLFKPFQRRTASATHYGLCPTTKEPLRLHQYVYSAFVD